ncbi:LL-diaminopimelate aminotransferase DapL [Thermoclostridium stercorarium subsp. stercorarium DSM 8532]|uniref:Aminotransferase n=3 Tax=Thermoclostridium stercorarium TaxID=1510 RepID=L7VT25_THES1|nr:aminotransferase class I/II-fold pyridoxal phosphate-dependent enzyme [Thermoclostridium stercorarium]AGC68673.1 LL-diaminopimelate aminotransferase DapL [Thermoclostridium stercorarium subsp. stercorarium DSM 8532]AGI39684.1 aspartate-tyrosine-aromatic aminotransferase [Thermoclostridium stercorarium subsp. stercorarium DSM 8532]ANW99010.1 LL-diaminopimelate aminotransferase [Thermoclostridium stercorarium subsp. thermolacticum DSM 2910]ANX01538.1 LL-diaminopimelate aminotransferase [Thermo
MKFSKRIDQLNEGIFAKLLEIKREKLARGEQVIDLSVGSPNIAPARHILDALCAAAADERNYTYAISDLPELLEAVSKWYKNRYGVDLDPKTEICSLMGSQEGFPLISMTVVDEGDLVLIPDPCYPIFADGPRMAGAKLYYMPQKRENGYIVNLKDIPEDIARLAKLMIVSYPNNPTTAVAPDEFYHELIAFAKEYDIIVLHDNAYSDLVFDNKRGGSFLAYPGAKDVGVEFNSLSKTYGIAGARIGFCVGNKEVVSRLKMLKSNLDYGMFIPIQKAAIAAITGDQSCVSRTREAYEIRRNILCDGFNSIGWHMKKPEATMFVWAPIPPKYEKSIDFAMDMLNRAGVMVTPGSAFGPSGEGHVRIALVQDIEDIKKAIEAVKRSGILD